MGSINAGSGGGFLGRTSRRGDPLRAEDVEDMKDAIRRGRISVAEPLQMQDLGPAGSVIWLGSLPDTGFWAQLTAGGLATEGGAGAGTAVPGDAHAGRYSFSQVDFQADGSALRVSGGVVGFRTDDSGWAREWDGVTNAPANLVVWMWPADAAAGEPAHYLFRFDFCVLARTKVLSAYPNVASRYYACETQAISGVPAEGGAATLTTQGDTFFAFNAGTAVPPQGTYVACGKDWTGRTSGGDGPPVAYFGFRFDG
jgi:hypothetical protein